MSSQVQGTHYWQGALMVFLGAIAFSTKAIFVKLAYRYPVDAISLLALRMIFSLPFFLVIAWMSRKQANTQIKKSDWFWIILLGMMGYYLASMLDFLGLLYVTASMERLILFSYPTIVLIASAILFKQPVQRIQYLALLFTYTGIAFAFWGDLQWQDQEKVYLGAGLIFGAAIVYALYLTGSGQLIPRWGARRFNAYAMSMAAFAVIFHASLAQPLAVFRLDVTVYLLSLAMALISTVIASFLITAGIGRIGASNAAIISSVGPISTIVLASIFLEEIITWYQIVGTGLVLLGVLMISLSRKSST